MPLRVHPSNTEAGLLRRDAAARHLVRIAKDVKPNWRISEAMAQALIYAAQRDGAAPIHAIPTLDALVRRGLVKQYAWGDGQYRLTDSGRSLCADAFSALDAASESPEDTNA